MYKLGLKFGQTPNPSPITPSIYHHSSKFLTRPGSPKRPPGGEVGCSLFESNTKKNATNGSRTAKVSSCLKSMASFRSDKPADCECTPPPQVACVRPQGPIERVHKLYHKCGLNNTNACGVGYDETTGITVQQCPSPSLVQHFLSWWAELAPEKQVFFAPEAPE